MCKRTAIVSAILMLFGICSAGNCKTIYVKTTGSDTKNGLSWDLAKKTITAGINASSAGDQVWVAKGIYLERITLKNKVALYGAFPTDGGAFDTRDYITNETTINGNQSGNVVIAPENADKTTVIDGFTIINGSGTSSGGGIRCLNFSKVTISNNIIKYCNITGVGGGIYCAYQSSPTIVGNTISNNTTSGDGGGIYCDNALPTISSNTISNNSNGGIYCWQSAALIVGNIIRGNTVTTFFGGGICCNTSSPTILRNVIDGNSAGSGGGIACKYSAASPTIISGNVIVNNSAVQEGGGIYCHICTVSITNNTIVRNSAGMLGSAIALEDLAICDIESNIAAFSTGKVIFRDPNATCVLGNNCVYNPNAISYSGLTAGDGDFSSDPVLVNNDCHLQITSPCIDRGSDCASTDELDIDSNPRTYGSIIDVGADELWPDAISVGLAKSRADNVELHCTDGIISAIFEGFFYVESSDRSTGVMVLGSTQGLSLGANTQVYGRIKTTNEGERYIDAVLSRPLSPANVEAVALTNKSLGGGDFNFDPNTGAGQRGVEDGVGLNNIGLLVKTTGIVTIVGNDFFYIDDGTHARDASIFNGIRVKCGIMTKPAVGQNVSVTGISSISKIGDRYFRCIRPRVQSDIAVL